MITKHLIYLLCLMALVTACSAPDDQAAEEAVQGSSRVPEDNVFSDQVRALEKAEDAKAMLDEAAAKQREQIDHSSQ